MFPIRDLSDVEVAFPASVLQIMPKYEEIPEEFKGGNTKWNSFFTKAFYCGLTKLELYPKEGVDPKKAWRHIRAVMGSFEPKHEHKEAAVAFLMNEWFKDVVFEAKKMELPSK